MTRDIFMRALKTFLQAVLGYICTLSLTSIDLGDDTVRTGLILAAISAGISALMNIDWKAEETEASGTVAADWKASVDEVMDKCTIEEEDTEDEAG